jgi:hypothetical protein
LQAKPATCSRTRRCGTPIWVSSRLIVRASSSRARR